MADFLHSIFFKVLDALPDYFLSKCYSDQKLRSLTPTKGHPLLWTPFEVEVKGHPL